MARPLEFGTFRAGPLTGAAGEEGSSRHCGEGEGRSTRDVALPAYMSLTPSALNMLSPVMSTLPAFGRGLGIWALQELILS